MTICEKCLLEKKICGLGLCESCYQKQRYKNSPKCRETKAINTKRWRNEHKKDLNNHKNNAVCTILRTSNDSLKNDPEKMTIKFKQEIININCENE